MVKVLSLVAVWIDGKSFKEHFSGLFALLKGKILMPAQYTTIIVERIKRKALKTE
jgi:hypothetical protein